MKPFFRKSILLEENNEQGGGGGSPSAAPQVVPPTLPAEVVSAYEKELRNENATYRASLKLKEAETDTVKAENAKLKADLEAAKLAEKAAVEAAETRLKDEFSAKTKISHLKAAVKDVLLDPDELDTLDISALKIGDDGKIEGLEPFLENLKGKRPYVFKGYHVPQSSTSSVVHRHVNPSDPKPFDANTLSPAEYKAAKQKLVSGKK